MEAILLLCDYADALNGKLYIAGGGWNRIIKVAPISVSIAVMIDVPWQAANERHSLLVTLQTEDGERVRSPEGNEVKIEGEFETGRPAGTKPGSPLRAPLALRLEGLDLPRGGYAFVLDIDGSEVARATFLVEDPTAQR